MPPPTRFQVLWTESLETRKQIVTDVAAWMLSRASLKDAAVTPVPVSETRPLLPGPFRVAGHPWTPWTRLTMPKRRETDDKSRLPLQLRWD